MDLKTEIPEDHAAYAEMVEGISNTILGCKLTRPETRLQALLNSTAATAKAFGVSKKQLLSEMSDRYDKVGV